MYDGSSGRHKALMGNGFDDEGDWPWLAWWLKEM